jgi:hypothetical protein
MTPVMQTVIHPEIGNCMQASVASLLDMELGQVPNWIELPEDEWVDIFLNWLWANGYEFHGEMPGSYISDVAEYTSGIDGHVIVKGSSNYPRGHMVIYKEGELSHDPAPAGFGVFEVQAFWMIERKEQ